MPKSFRCPLCNSVLSKSRYFEIIGIWEERKKLEVSLKKKLSDLKEMKSKLIKEKSELKKQMQKRIKEETKKALEKGRVAERKRIQQKLDVLKKEKEKLSKTNLEMIRKFRIQLKEATKEAREKAIEVEKKRTAKLSEMLKGKTEQMNALKVKMKGAVKEASEKAREFEKKRAEKLAGMLEGKMDKINKLNSTIKELKQQLKEGITPQIAGLDLEKELVKELKKRFPMDIIEHHGKGGDIVHHVIYKKKQVGIIVYECKKTGTFSSSHVRQIKDAVSIRKATYGVLVTTAPKKGKAGFWVEKGILIVHPFGAIYIAEVLRARMIDFYLLKISGKQLQKRAKELMEYIKSDEFKTYIEDSIYRTKELFEMLRKETISHKHIWKDRLKHYVSIYRNVSLIQQNSRKVLKGEKPSKELEEKVEVPLIAMLDHKK